ncbi:hypothetical protein niasHS_012912 [Heterodera schachtii]|uniref:ANK_REP_REGION domain-containing protein n=1 Tax=Heterodera schachtii TaxID=97005 RepID=A0ABD2IBZ9_HETSC
MLLLVDFFVFFLFVLCPSFVIFSIFSTLASDGPKNGTADNSESGSIVDGQQRQNSAIVAPVPSPSSTVPVTNRSPVAAAFCEAIVQPEQQPKATGTQNKEMANESEKLKLLFTLAKSGGVARMHAILSGCDAVELKRLLAATENGATLLDVAAQNDQTEVAKLLLEKSAIRPTDGTDSVTIRLVTMNKLSPFWAALLREQTKLVEIMLEYGQNPNEFGTFIRDEKKQNIISPLHFAAQKGNLAMCKLLVAKGAKVNQRSKDKRGIVPLHIACGNGHLSIVKFFLERAGADIESTDSDGDTALVYALLENKLDIGHYLITGGAHIDRTNKIGISPLHIFVKKGDFALCKFLIDNGANVNQKTTDDSDHQITPLHIACAEGQLKIVKLLMNSGANVNEKSGGQGTAPLHVATAIDHFPIVKLLVEEGNADIESTDSEGDTPLHWALVKHNFEIARFLSDKGARTDRPNNAGLTPHQLIGFLGIHLLLSAAANANDDDDH